jgi:hypothetical protein
MKSSTTLNQLILSSESTANSQLSIGSDAVSRRIRRSNRLNKSVVNAVYAYIRAIRALGRTNLVTTEVASALSIPVAEVNRAITSLKEKGVRPING